MSRTRPRSTRTIVWLLTLVLLLAQTLGMMHAALHGSGLGAGAHVAKTALDINVVKLAAGVTATDPDAASASRHGWLASLFSAHTSDADCRLYDQASHGSAAIHVACFALPVVLPSFAVAIFQGEALARWAALFDARGPPLTL